MVCVVIVILCLLMKVAVVHVSLRLVVLKPTSIISGYSTEVPLLCYMCVYVCMYVYVSIYVYARRAFFDSFQLHFFL